MQTLQEYLQSQYNQYSNTDIEWELFVKDHMNHILKNSTTIKINPNEMHKYTYRLSEFLEYKKINVSLGWIVLWLNQLSCNEDFSNLASIVVPEEKLIQEYKNKYDSDAAKKRRIV